MFLNELIQWDVNTTRTTTTATRLFYNYLSFPKNVHLIFYFASTSSILRYIKVIKEHNLSISINYFSETIGINAINSQTSPVTFLNSAYLHLSMVLYRNCCQKYFGKEIYNQYNSIIAVSMNKTISIILTINGCVFHYRAVIHSRIL